MTKSSKELYIEKIYKNILNKIEKSIGNLTTYSTQLERLGKKLFGIKFRGVFASNQIPKLSDLTPYCILNLDKSTQPGSHWISISKTPSKQEIVIYDSFARKHNTIIKALAHSGNGRIIDSDLKDREQEIHETNCGQKSISWLVVVDKYGIDLAKLI